MTKRKLPSRLPPPDLTIIAAIEHWFDLIAAVMTTEAGRALMERVFAAQLERSDAATLPTEEIIEAAECGNEAAHRALCGYIRPRMDQDQWLQLPVQLRNYAIKSLDPDRSVTYPRGKTDVVDTWTRDIAANVLIDRTSQFFKIPSVYTRGVATLPAVYFVSHVLRGRGIELKENRLIRIHKYRHKLAKRVAASLYPSLGDF
jgi:hypothetical protein